MRLAVLTAIVALAAILCGGPDAHANVIIGGTRVVFPAARGEVTVRLSNQGTRPALVEAWIDTGDINSTPATAHAPFLITPPLFRMEPARDQSLRILYAPDGAALPADRESLFWLNVLEVPPRPTGAAASANSLQFAIRSRLKVFYRPAKLPGDPLQAPARLVFSVAGGRAGVTLSVHNPTPYFITLNRISLGKINKPLEALAGMVAPFADLHLPLDGLPTPPAVGTPVTFTTIDDYGAGNAYQSTLTR